MSLIHRPLEVHDARSLGLAGKKKTVKPDARLAARKRARAKSAPPKSTRAKSTRSKSAQRPDKRRIAHDATRTENVRLAAELRAALDRRNASAEILRIISQSPTDVQPVFDAIVLTATRLFHRDLAFILGTDATTYWPLATAGPEGLRTPPDPAPVAIDSDTNFPSRVIVTGKNLHLPDWSAIELPEYERMVHQRLGINSALYLPLLREGKCIGVLGIAGKRAGIFGKSEIALAESFRDQALIAVENTRLFNETRETLERQTATADILKVIASSPSDVQPVFEAIATSANRLIGGFSTTVYRFIDGALHLMAFTPTTPAADEFLQASFPSPVAQFPLLELVHDGNAAQIADTETLPDVRLKTIARARGFRSMLFTPLLSNGAPIGMIGVTRLEPSSFAAHHVQLLQTFADQAVIAIENVRLFDEVQARTNDLQESLQQQTATADVLKVISRSAFDLDSVMNTLASSAAELCTASLSGLYLREGDVLVMRGHSDVDEALARWLRQTPIQIDDETYMGRAVLSGNIANIADFENDPNTRLRTIQKALEYKAILFVPLMREGRGVGVFALSRDYVGAFSQRQVELVQTFADQAVIAIENARLFDEVQARTADLQESLQQQTATADVLKVISRSAFDLQTVLDTLVESALRLCSADEGTIWQPQEGRFVLTANSGLPPGKKRFVESISFERGSPGPAGRALSTGQTLHIHDILADATYPYKDDVDPARTRLYIPLMRDREAIGIFILSRREVRPFSDKQLELVQTFADQAVIAIENVRLFDEVQARTRDLSESLQQQTATADVLKVISRSAFDLDTVMNTLATSAAELCTASLGGLYLREGDVLVMRGHSDIDQALARSLRQTPIRIDNETHIGRAVLSGTIANIADFEHDPNTRIRTFQETLGFKAILFVPLMREGRGVGVFALTRDNVGAFSQRQIELVQTFADQAVIAIENVRLFDEVQARTKELAASLDDLRTAQDRLVQTEKLASLGQLTAGIAHEIKNPLNFVNNFSALSAELTDELLDVLKPASLNDTTRKDVDELTQMLKDNLQKVVQHGKRADSIVKNMLLHSREGSGDHRPADINALLDESLNLAYHGARAEKPQFNVTLQRNFDATAGTIEVFPQEITRVFLNLISNGFYAVTKRKTEHDNPDFEPAISAATRNLGDRVEIRIRDNGTGIPAEVREKMFNPFFTTKPAGEGTGLGLSMSHDIIVKQHGGTVDVETEPGQFTEFRIVLPRTSNLQEKKRGQS
jgi:two-component system, NtrC family, sensor kinase